MTGVVLVTMLVPDAFLRGEVLSQGSRLYEYLPWSAYTPADLRRPNPLLSDPALMFYPWLTHTVHSIRGGELPIWNAGLFGGHPFLASFQTALFSPFTAIALVVPLPRATVFIALAPLIVGGVGMFRFIRSLGLTTAASWFGGIAYLLNGFAVAWMEHPLTAVACWMPWILHATDSLVRRPDTRRAAGLAVLLAVMIVAGHPETATKILLVAASYLGAAVVCDGRSGPHRATAWRLGALAYALGGMLASIQIVPFLEYLWHSEALAIRSAQGVNRFFMPLATAITALVPDFFGNPADGTYVTWINRAGFAANHAEQAVYAGLPVVVTAPLALIARREHWRVWFFAGWAVLAAALMYGMPGLVHAVSAIPVLGVMVLARFGLIVIVGLTVLAAYGVDRLTRGAENELPRARGLIVATAATVLTIIVIGGVVAFVVPDMDAIASRTAQACGVAAVLVLSMTIAALLRIRGTLSPPTFATIACALLALDLMLAGRGVHPTVPPSQVYPTVPELEHIRRDRDLFRVYGWATALNTNTGLPYGLQDARGWDGVNPFRYTRLLDLGYLRQSSDAGERLRAPAILDLLNVKYVFVPTDVALAPPRYTRVEGMRAPLYVNTRAFPRAFLVDRYAVLTDDDLKRTLHDGSVDLSRTVLLETELPPDDRPEAAPPSSVVGRASVRHYRDTFVEIEVDAPGRRILVVSDAHYPGWTAAVDGVPARLVRADYAIRAVPLPAGRHVVTLRYRPWSVRLGAILSLTALAVLATASVGSRMSTG